MSKHKVVYNACYGGFSLSEKAIRMLAEMGVEEAKEQLSTIKRSPFNSYYVYDIRRHDKRLIEVVEKLGDEANGAFAQLQIAELEGNKYRIDEYDGTEGVIEPNEEEWTVIE